MDLRMSAARRLGPRHLAAAVSLLTTLATTISACSPPEAPAQRPAATDTIDVQQGITYWSDKQVDLQLDACVPPATGEPVSAVLLVHGGGFTTGDRASGGMRELCEFIAKHGYVAFSIDYRTAPAYTYPAQVDDLANAVLWLRQPAQARRFGVDPAHIGVIGSSAGAIMAQSLATRGTGALDTGARIAAVVSLSGVSVMTADAEQLGHPSRRAAELVLAYLGCNSPAGCPQAEVASPISAVDPSDPPTLLVNGTDELVPREQPETMATALRSAGVPVDLQVVDGPQHGVALLNADIRNSIVSFLGKYL